MIYVSYATYHPDADKVQACRPTHQQYIFALLAKGHVVAAGSFPDGSGGLFVYEAESLEQARAFMENDPYIEAGAVTHYTVKEWEIHGAVPALLRTIYERESGIPVV